jgi:hypothetical protein
MRHESRRKKQLPPLWKCPKCGVKLVTRNLRHSCGKFSLKELFKNSEPQVWRVFQRFAREIRRIGPVEMIPQKSRVVFMTRIRFAGGTPRKSYFDGGFLLNRKIRSPRFSRVTQYGPRMFGYRLRMESEEIFDAEFRRWLCESYRVGMQGFIRKGK